MELLTLFCDKGIAIQNAAISTQRPKVEAMTEQLASLLLPIDALLSHSDFTVGPDVAGSLTTLFRNMWFTCVLFQFTSSDEGISEGTAMEWQRPALTRIAIKTPPIVLDETHDTIVSDLEYNPVIRREYAETVSAKRKICVVCCLCKRLGHQQAQGPAHQAYIVALQRNQVSISWADHFFTLYARS